MEKTIVAYFSASGVTAKVAERLARVSGAELFEIKPEQPYTEKDLNWTNPVARCNREKIGRKDVPIKDRIEDFDGCGVIFVGFPIWYYSAPNIIVTFLKSYDFTGKKVALFATSGGSDIGRTAEKIGPLIPASVNIVASKRFLPSDGDEVLARWAQGVI